MIAAFHFPAAQFAAPLLPAGPSHGTRRRGLFAVAGALFSWFGVKNPSIPGR
ncbi:hypothetical protein SpAn4DRAFT_2864 [Sporomusa ovata]|uniref:Uncharacterized protein n=1 Tax=Sporomusa ovata TaxID=2378 RepID=A0A0U1L0F4_9FIRM|nr:hypothetical protein SpAn4DRAFT_2864 [Sporomusa ovata]